MKQNKRREYVFFLENYQYSIIIDSVYTIQYFSSCVVKYSCTHMYVCNRKENVGNILTIPMYVHLSWQHTSFSLNVRSMPNEKIIPMYFVPRYFFQRILHFKFFYTVQLMGKNYRPFLLYMYTSYLTRFTFSFFNSYFYTSQKKMFFKFMYTRNFIALFRTNKEEGKFPKYGTEICTSTVTRKITATNDSNIAS